MASPQQPHSCLHHVQGWCDSVRNPKPPFFFPAEVSRPLKAFKLKLINPTTHFPSQTPEHFLNTKVTATKSHCGLANLGELTSRWFQLKRFASRLQRAGSTRSCCTAELRWCTTSLQHPHFANGKNGTRNYKGKRKRINDDPHTQPKR